MMLSPALPFTQLPAAAAARGGGQVVDSRMSVTGPDDVVDVVDSAAARSLLGASSDEKAGNAKAYVATFDPEQDTSYFVVTRERGLRPADVRRKATPSQLLGRDGERGHRRTRLVFSKFSADEIDGTRRKVREAMEAAGATGAFSFDPASDAILLDISDGQVRGLRLPTTPVPVITRSADTGDSVYRENMPAPFRGGGAIFDASKGRCTSGVPALNASGTRGYFTAAHCFAAGSWVWSSSGLSGVSNTGKVSHRYGTSVVDAEFVSGDSYVGHIYNTNSMATSKPIRGTYFPAPDSGALACFSGSTMGVICDNYVISYSASFCGSTGCNDDLIALRGGVATEPGDSGGPVYANFGTEVRVTGIIRGYSDPWVGDSTTFVTDWRRIAANYGAKVMTG